MAPTNVSYKPIIDSSTQSTQYTPLTFDPEKHLAYQEPANVITMKDIGFQPNTGISPIAVSQPFRLFSKDAIEEMRREIFKPEVMAECTFRSNIAACQLRGYCPKYAPFAYDAWTHPETLELLSKIAGVDLVPQMDYEIGHINLSVKSDRDVQKECNEIEAQKQLFASDEGISGCPWEDDKPVVGWHTDSYPFVCVLMLSDCTDMVGGETALRTGTGDILKVRGPEMGCAVVMQGRYITHQALRALGTKERITSVTSFRPRSAFVRDDTVLTSVRPVSKLPELYYQFGEYRLEILEERIRQQLAIMRKRHTAGKKLGTKAFKQFLETQIAFLKDMNNEIVDEENVQTGICEKMDISDVKVGGSDNSQPAKEAGP